MRLRRRSKQQNLQSAALALKQSASMDSSAGDELVSSWLMMKRGGIMSAAFWTWKRRFVKLDGDHMLLYSDDGPGAEFKGTLAVNGISVTLSHAKNAGFRSRVVVNVAAW